MKGGLTLNQLNKKDVVLGLGEIMSEELSKLSPTQQKYLLSNKERLGELALNSFVEFTKKSLKEKKSIFLKGFAAFDVQKRETRKGRNPRTQEEIIIPEHLAPWCAFCNRSKVKLQTLKSK